MGVQIKVYRDNVTKKRNGDKFVFGGYLTGVLHLRPAARSRLRGSGTPSATAILSLLENHTTPNRRSLAR